MSRGKNGCLKEIKVHAPISSLLIHQFLPSFFPSLFQLHVQQTFCRYFFEVIFMFRIFLAPPFVEETSRTLSGDCACAQKLELLEANSVPVWAGVSSFFHSSMTLKFWFNTCLKCYCGLFCKNFKYGGIA